MQIGVTSKHIRCMFLNFVFSVLSKESANEIPLNLAKTNLQEACCNTQYILMMLMMMMMFILGTKAFGTNVICHRKGLVSPEKSHR